MHKGRFRACRDRIPGHRPAGGRWERAGPLAGRLPLQAGGDAVGRRFGASLTGTAVCAAAIRAARRVQAGASPHIRRIRPSVRARFAPPRRRAAGPSPAAQALPGQTSARSVPHRRLRQCPACGARERQRRRSIRQAAKSRRRAVASGAGAAGPNTSPLGAAAAPPLDSPRRDVAPQGCRRQRRRCRAKHQPARRRIAACANAPPASPASASAAAAAHAACAKPRLRAAGRPEPVLPRRAVRAAAALRRRRHLPLACGLLRLGAAAPRSIGFASAGPRSFRAGMRGALRRAGSAGPALARRERPGPSAALWPSWAATGRKPARRAGGRARGRQAGPAWSRILKTGGGWGGCAPSSSRRHRRGEAACGTPPLGRWAEDVDGRLPRPRACALIRAGGGYGSHFWPVHEKVIELTCRSAQLRPELPKSGARRQNAALGFAP